MHHRQLQAKQTTQQHRLFKLDPRNGNSEFHLVQPTQGTRTLGMKLVESGEPASRGLSQG